MDLLWDLTCSNTNLQRALSHFLSVAVEVVLPQVISGNGPSICPVSEFLIKTGGFSFNFACVLFEKCLKIGGLCSANELFKKLKTYKALLSLI